MGRQTPMQPLPRWMFWDRSLRVYEGGGRSSRHALKPWVSRTGSPRGTKLSDSTDLPGLVSSPTLGSRLRNCLCRHFEMPKQSRWSDIACVQTLMRTRSGVCGYLYLPTAADHRLLLWYRNSTGTNHTQTCSTWLKSFWMTKLGYISQHSCIIGFIFLSICFNIGGFVSPQFINHCPFLLYSSFSTYYFIFWNVYFFFV